MEEALHKSLQFQRTRESESVQERETEKSPLDFD